MPKANLTRRTITWSKATDEALQAFLGPKAANVADLSEFVEDSVRWRLFDRTVQAIKDRNASLDPDQVQDEIDQAVQEVRKEMARERSRSAAS
jgi:hypothetical protein